MSNGSLEGKITFEKFQISFDIYEPYHAQSYNCKPVVGNKVKTLKKLFKSVNDFHCIF